MMAAPEDPEDLEPAWNAEGDELAFLRDEGLELLALFRSIRDKRKRKLVMDLLRVLAKDQE